MLVNMVAPQRTQKGKAMHSIFYIIGVIVVIIAVLSFLGLT